MNKFAANNIMLCYIIMKIIAFLKKNMNKLLMITILVLVVLIFRKIMLVREGNKGKYTATQLHKMAMRRHELRQQQALKKSNKRKDGGFKIREEKRKEAERKEAERKEATAVKGGLWGAEAIAAMAKKMAASANEKATAMIGAETVRMAKERAEREAKAEARALKNKEWEELRELLEKKLQTDSTFAWSYCTKMCGDHQACRARCYSTLPGNAP